MQAVILSGGLGTRLRELFNDRPKTLVPVAGKPMLQWQVEFLSSAGITRVHLAASYLAEQVEEWASKQAWPGITFTCSVEPEPLGTGGGLKYAESQLQGDRLVVVNGDSLIPNLKLEALLEAHVAAKSLVTLAVVPIEAAGSYGTVEFDENNRLTAFREKADHSAGWVNGGVYVMERTVLDAMEHDTSLSLEHVVFPMLAQAGSVGVYPGQPPLLDMGTPEGLGAMERYLQQQR